MAKTTMSQFGAGVCVDNEKEHLVPALGNGAAVPGDLCGITAADGKVLASQTGAVGFIGILKEDPVTGNETAIVAGVPCSLIVPKSGHRYRIRCNDLAGDYPVGTAMGFVATDYKLGVAADIVHAIARLSSPYTDDDLVCEVTWA